MRRRMPEPAPREGAIARLLWTYLIEGFALHGAALMGDPHPLTLDPAKNVFQLPVTSQ